MPLLETKGVASAQGFGFSLQRAGAVQAEAIDFGGANDFVERSSLTGAAPGKTFTISAWLWLAATTPSGYVYFTSGGFGFRLWYSTTEGRILLEGFNSAGTRIVYLTGPALTPANTFFNFLVSFDLTNAANRWFYLNDVFQSSGWSTYSNQNVSFGSGTTQIGTGLDDFIGRLSNIYLDQTYRDLSVEANRRLFVTADLKPAAGQAALNPILYLPLSDPTAPGLNQGTGGNFTLTGVVARSGRGPNQYNAPYSVFDGSADYLESTSAPAGIANGKTFTVHFAFATTSLSVLQRPITFSTSTAIRFTVSILTTGNLYINGVNASGVTVLEAQTANATFSINRNYVVEISIDLANTSNRHIYVNGVSASTTWFTYSDDLIQFLITTTPRYRIGANAATTPAQYFVGRLGALWFNTSYIDLSQAANLAKFVSGTGINAAPVDLGATGQLPTGTSPLLYLPLYGNNAARNLGTGGGGFGVISGPYAGARGPNEFWGNKARQEGGIYLANLGISFNSSTFTMSFWMRSLGAGANGRAVQIGQAGANYLYVQAAGANSYRVSHFNPSSGATFSSNTFSTSSGAYVQFSKNGSTYTLHVNGTSIPFSGTVPGNVTCSNLFYLLSTSGDSADDLELSEVYMSTQFVDFSQEANRLRFRDAFGNPTDLPSAITAMSVPTPFVYMRFPPTSFVTNSGTDGNFNTSGTGTIRDGGQL